MTRSIILQAIVIVQIYIDYWHSLKKGVYDLWFVIEILLLLVSLYLLMK